MCDIPFCEMFEAESLSFLASRLKSAKASANEMREKALLATRGCTSHTSFGICPVLGSPALLLCLASNQ